MNKYQTLAANTALISIGTLGSKLLVFLMVRFYTGYLTPAEYGTADLITQTANLIIPVASLDIAEGVFRFAADRRAQREQVFSVGVYTVLLGAAALLAALPLLRRVAGDGQLGLLLAGFVVAACTHALCAQFIRAEGHTGLYAVQGICNTAGLYCPECAVPCGASLGRDGIPALHRCGGRLKHAVPGLQGTALAQIPRGSRPDAVAQNACLLCTADSGGRFLVGHGRVGPVYGKVVPGQRCQRHLCCGL